MDLQEFIVVLLVIFLEGERQKIRLMNESLMADRVALQEKERERSMLMRNNQDMLAKEAAKEKLVDDFMAFIGANKNNENAHNFDEKAMMKAIETMMNSDGDDNGGFANGYGKRLKIRLMKESLRADEVALQEKERSVPCL
ncbi:uncharacterized protein LOC111294652 [Durio zibethinus]|uniref:Uncharacterized protein LOC111294652 n=1 Tax=Durio zibethinus TaxID=66656 RepID=A0A6P5YTE0_DURZI|nr:uncharacterized protein LOC111294652 [Durio zibethinus]